MVQIRLCCNHFDHIHFYEEGKQELSGVSGHLSNVVFQGLTHKHHNVTFKFLSDSKFGSLIDVANRIYDGCIGKVQRNESDWAVIQVPIGDYGPNLTQGPAIGFEKIGIFSSYNMTNVVNETNILQTFNSFSLSLWSQVVMTFAFFAFFLFSALSISRGVRKTRRDRKDFHWILFKKSVKRSSTG